MKKAKKKNTHLHFLLFIFNTTFLITYSKRKRKERKEGKGEDRKIKGNVKTAVTLFNPKDFSKFCFLCICNLLKLTFASGMEGCKVLDLWIVFWVVLAFNSQTMTGGFFFAEGEGGGQNSQEHIMGYRGGSRIFFRRGCAHLLLHFNTNKPHTFFFCRIPDVLENRRLSWGRGGAHPLHSPPRSAPGVFIRPQVLFLPWGWNLISERFRHSTFLQKGQLCWLKKAEKLSFCIHFRRTKCKIVTFFVYPCRLG